MAFNFVGRLQLVGPANLSQVVSQINRQLSGIRANVTINVSPNVSTRINALNTQLSALNTQLSQVAINAQRAQLALTNLAAGLNNLNSVTLKLPSSLNNSNNALSKTKQFSEEATQGIKQFGEQAGLATRRFLAFSLAAGSLVGVANFFKQGIQNAIEFERQLVRLNQVGSGTREEISGISREISRVSTAYGSSSRDLSEVAVTLRQAGIEAGGVRVALDALAQSTLSPSFGSLNNTVEGLIATFSQFNIRAEQSAEVLGSINAVSAGLAVEAEDITTAIQRAGGSFALLANASNTPIQNLREFIAVFSSVRATTRESADTIATGLRSVFTRFQRPEVVDSLRELGINLRYTRREAEALGNVRLENQFVGAYEAVVRLSDGLRNIPNTSSQFAQIVESLGGIRQVSRILPLLSEGGVALRQQALALSRAGSTSLDSSTQKGLESLAVRGKQVYEEFQKLFRLITEDTGFQVFAKGLLLLAEGLGKVLQLAKPLIPVLLTLASASLFRSIGTFGAGFAKKFVSSQGSSYYNIRGYASGGKVGGVGNKDTEIAALTPGEYVIKKDVAQRIGYNNLEKANGGLIKFGAGGPASNAKFLDSPVNNFYIENGKLYNRPRYLGIFGPEGNSLFSGEEGAKPSLKKAFKNQDLEDKTINPGDLLFTSVDAKSRLANFYNSSVSFYTNRAKVISGGGNKKSNKLASEYTDVRNTNSFYRATIGNELEVQLQRLLTKPQAFNIDTGAGADINNLGKSGAAFKNPKIAGKILTNVVDLNLKTSQRTSNFPQAAKDFLKAQIDKKLYIDYSNVQVADIKKAGGQAEKIENDVQDQVGAALEDYAKSLHGGNFGSGQKFRANELANGGLVKMAGGGVVPGVGNTDNFPALLNDGDFVIKKSSAQRAGYGTLNALANNKFAEGGVVPALLMPGEYVFDKDQVGKIGKTNLENLNRTGQTSNIRKYASGGFVRMKTGGTPLEEFLKQGTIPGFSFSNRSTVKTSSVISSVSSTLQKALEKQVAATFQNATAEEKQAIVARETLSFLNKVKQLQQGRILYDETINKIKQDEIKLARAENRVSRRLSRGDIQGAEKAQLQVENPRNRIIQGKINLDTLSKDEAKLVKETSIITDKNNNITGFAGQELISPEPRKSLRERFGSRESLLLAAQLALPYVGQISESIAGPANSSSGFGFTAAKAVGGGTQGTAIGASLGTSLTGVIPGATIIGAVGGGLLGVFSSIKQAEKEIREVKIAAALVELKQSFTSASRDIRLTGRVSESSTSRIRTFLGQGVNQLGGNFVDREYGFLTVLRRAVTSNPFTLQSNLTAEAGQRYSDSLSRLSSRRSGETLSDTDSALLRDLTSTFGDSIGNLREVFETEITSFLRTNPGATDEQLLNRLRTRFNPESVSVYSALSGGAVATTELLTDTRRRGTRESISSSDRVFFNQFDRLSSTLEALNQSFARLAVSSQNIDNILSGSGQQAKPTPISLSNFNDPNFRTNVEIVRRDLGIEGRAGAAFTQFGESASVLNRYLEDSIRDAIDSGTGTSGVQEAFERRTRSSGISAPLLARLSSRIGSLTENVGPTTDAGRLASETVASLFGPGFQRLAEIRDARENSVIDTLNRYNSVLKQSIDLQLKGNDLRFQQAQIESGFEANNRGLGSSAGILFNRLGSQDRYDADLRGLLSPTILHSFGTNLPTPERIGTELNTTLARSREISNLRTPEATEERSALARSSQSYISALNRMADVTTRTATIQENLNRLQQSRDARIGFNRNYLTTDPESRFRTEQGLLLAQNLQQSGGDLGDLSLENRRLIDQALQQVGNGRLGFADGLTGTELSNQFYSNTRYGITQPPNEEADIRRLQSEIIDVYRQATTATLALETATRNELPRSMEALGRTLEELRLATVNLNATLVSTPPTTSISESFGRIVHVLRGGLFPPLTRSSGGPVPYYSRGGSPRGTDTVPAMLTPGEYVVNARATARHRGLLENINSGNYLSGGGEVSYLLRGGPLSGTRGGARGGFFRPLPERIPTEIFGIRGPAYIPRPRPIIRGAFGSPLEILPTSYRPPIPVRPTVPLRPPIPFSTTTTSLPSRITSGIRGLTSRVTDTVGPGLRAVINSPITRGIGRTIGGIGAVDIATGLLDEGLTILSTITGIERPSDRTGIRSSFSTAREGLSRDLGVAGDVLGSLTGVAERTLSAGTDLTTAGFGLGTFIASSLAPRDTPEIAARRISARAEEVEAERLAAERGRARESTENPGREYSRLIALRNEAVRRSVAELSNPDNFLPADFNVRQNALNDIVSAMSPVELQAFASPQPVSRLIRPLNLLESDTRATNFTEYRDLREIFGSTNEPWNRFTEALNGTASTTFPLESVRNHINGTAILEPERFIRLVRAAKDTINNDRILSGESPLPLSRGGVAYLADGGLPFFPTFAPGEAEARRLREELRIAREREYYRVLSNEALNNQSLIYGRNLDSRIGNNLRERQVLSRLGDRFNSTDLSSLEEENNVLNRTRDTGSFAGASLDFNTIRRLRSRNNIVSGSFLNIPRGDVRELRRRGLFGLGINPVNFFAEGGYVDEATNRLFNNLITGGFSESDARDFITRREANLRTGPATPSSYGRDFDRTRESGLRGLRALVDVGYSEDTARRMVAISGHVPRRPTPTTTTPTPVSATQDDVLLRIRTYQNLIRNGYSNAEAEDYLERTSTGVSSVLGNFFATTFRSHGGLIYANKGQFIPRGTDTVPAMLTPGEYVVNRAATQKFRPLLEQINTQHLASGGQVQHLANGGTVNNSGGLNFSTEGFESASRDISKAFINFGNTARELIQSISSIPSTIQLNATHKVEIIHNGVEIFAKMEPMIKDLVVGEASKQLEKFVKDKLPDLQ